jgi:hypothetical protein
VVNATLRPLCTWERDLLPIEQEAGWAPAPLCMGAEDLALPGFGPQTIQHVMSCCTDYAIPPHILLEDMAD